MKRNIEDYQTALDEIKSSKSYKNVLNIIKENHFVNDRIDRLEEEDIDIEITEKAMGPGGVGQMKIIKEYVYIQIGSGHGRCNYAKVVKIGFIKDSELYGKHFIETAF